jgi:hypothetical protein
MANDLAKELTTEKMLNYTYKLPKLIYFGRKIP